MSSSEGSDSENYMGIAEINRTNVIGNPTVAPAINFDPIKDAVNLSTAFKNYDKECNKDLVVEIFCHRSLEQRLIFMQEYYKTHGNLLMEIKQKVDSDLHILLVSLLMPISQLNLDYLYEAFTKRDFDTVSDIIFTMSNDEIKELKQNYQQKHGKSLEKYISTKTSQYFQELLLKVCSTVRDESSKTDFDAAHNDAKEIISSIATESTFTEIFGTRSFQQIKLICDEYLKLSGETIEQRIKSKFLLEDKQGYLCIARYAIDKFEFYAKRLHRSMAGIGTNDNQLIRIIVTRAEVDLEDIKYSFARKFGKSLKTWIKGDTSGHYKYCLYGLIGEKRSGK